MRIFFSVNICDSYVLCSVSLAGVTATIMSQTSTRVVVTANNSSTDSIGSVIVMSAKFGAIAALNGYTYGTP